MDCLFKPNISIFPRMKIKVSCFSCASLQTEYSSCKSLCRNASCQTQPSPAGVWGHSPNPTGKFHDKHPSLCLDASQWALPCLILSRLCEEDVLSALTGYHSCFRRISEETISLWQSEFVILSNHLGCLQNFSRWQRFVDKCFVSQVISFSATVAILINWTYDRVCQDWKYCHSMQRVLLSELTATFIVLEME